MHRMVSGLFLSGAKSGYNAVEFNRMGQEAFDTGSYWDYISLGLLADHDSEAYRYAEEIRAKLNAGKAVTNIEMGQLTAAVYADALGMGEKRSEETREEPDDRTLREYVKSTLDDFQTDLERAFGEEETDPNFAEKEFAEEKTTVDTMQQKSIMNAGEAGAFELSSHNMHNTSDVLYERSKHVPSIEGYDDVFIHGDRWGVSTKDADGNDISIPNNEFIHNLKSLKLENHAIRFEILDE